MPNYTIPPRSKPSDLTKGRITQDEIIALQIANDANIANARKSFQRGEVQQLSPIEASSPQELLADDAQQEASAMTNLKRLGFRDAEASTIITAMRDNPALSFTSFNTNFPSIEDDIRKRFNVKLITPSFFLEYLNQFSSDLDTAIGVNVGRVFNAGVGSKLNHLVNTVAELRQVIPTRDDVGVVYDLVRRNGILMGQIGDDTVDRLRRIEQAIPAPVDYQRIEALGAVDRQRIIAELQNNLGNLPSRADFAQLVDGLNRGSADARQRLEALANSIDDQTLELMDELRREIQATEQSIKRGMRRGAEEEEPSGMGGARRVPSLVSEMTGTTAESSSTLGSALSLEKATLAEIKSTLRANPDLARRLRDLQSRDNVPLNIERLQKKPTGAGYQGDKVWIGDTNLEEIFKAKFGRGMMGRSVHIKTRSNRLKVGRGIAVRETPSYREYGKYAIHMPQLESQDILNVKYKSLGQIPKFKPIAVSDIFRDFLIDLVENGKPNARVYTQISPQERKFFEEMSMGAGVWTGLGLKRTTTSTDEEEAKRFELLKGEYMAGNNNPKVISELRRLIVKMMNDGRIRKSQGVDLLMELSI